MKKLLIVEDDSVVAHVYSGFLQKAGFQTKVATDGQRTMEEVLDFRPDAILLDLMLPNINGLALLQKIRGLRDFQKTPLVVYTSAFVPNVIQTAIQLGATKVFDKASVTPHLLLVEFRQALEKTQGN